MTQIRCVNKKCKALNSIEEVFCHRCQTPVVKKYLWIKGQSAEQYQVGELIDNRFLVCYPRIVLDTQPNKLTIKPAQLPDEIKSYLRLFSHRLHIPQVYGYIKLPSELWLLEYESVPLSSQGQLIDPKFFPSIESSFHSVTPLRQISWLWQIVQLWKPLALQKVLSSLFIPDNIRVNGNIVKLIELHFEGEDSHSLKDLGDLWFTWLPYFDPLIQDILKKIILSLQQELITNIDRLLDILDQVTSILGNNFYERNFQLITLTDPGKRREINEDSCYPAVDNLKETKRGLDTLAIVCDGLGGQEAGEVASRLAIDVIQGSLKESYKMTLQATMSFKYWTPLIDAKKIHQAVTEANDQITKLNNDQQRRKKERMGTTATVGMAIAHEVYLSNVGDSRIYWITPDSCHQVSVDDDMATKKVRNAEGLYRLIAADPQMGILLQALGVDYSNKLKVHVRRFIVDEDSLFLLCSDGLSDYGRVEQYWRSEILPVIQGKKNLQDAAKSLLDIGVNKNGHDNVTLALLYCQVKSREEPERVEELTWQYLAEVYPNLPQPQEVSAIDPPTSPESSSPETLSEPFKNNSFQQPQKLILLSILILAGVIGWWFWSQRKSSQNQSSSNVLAIVDSAQQVVARQTNLHQRVNL